MEHVGDEAYWEDFFAEDDVFYGSVSGFKGLERTCVVLAVNGFSAQARAKQMLYVGLSRARSQLVVVGDLDEIAPTAERGRCAQAAAGRGGVGAAGAGVRLSALTSPQHRRDRRPRRARPRAAPPAPAAAPRARRAGDQRAVRRSDAGVRVCACTQCRSTVLPSARSVAHGLGGVSSMAGRSLLASSLSTSQTSTWSSGATPCSGTWAAPKPAQADDRVRDPGPHGADGPEQDAVVVGVRRTVLVSAPA